MIDLKKEKENLKKALLNLVKQHYKVEIWNINDNTIWLNFYHLNDVYNAFIKTTKGLKNAWVCEQYASPTKKAIHQAKRVGNATSILLDNGKYDEVEKIINYFASISHTIYNALYNLKKQIEIDSL